MIGDGDSTSWTALSTLVGLSTPTWYATGTGKVQRKITFSTPSTKVDIDRWTGQDMLVPEVKEADPVTTTPEPFDVVMDFQPVAISDVGAYKVVDQGDPIGDILTVSAQDDPWIEIDGDPVDVLWEGQYLAIGDTPVTEPSATPPAGSEVLAEAQIVSDGPGVYDIEVTEGTAVPGMGNWWWQMVKSHQAAGVQQYIRADWSDQFGLAAETTSTRHKIEVDSDLAIRETKSGIYLVDDIWQDGFADDHGQFTGGAGFGADDSKMTHTAYFFPQGLEVTDETLSQATVLAPVTTAAENGFFASVGSTKWKVLVDESGARLPGTYVVVSEHRGDDRTAPFASSVTDPAEQYVVLPEPLEVTTQIQTDREVVDGAEVVFTDDSMITGTVPDGGVTVINDLHKWQTTGDPVCTEETLVAAGEAITVTAAGTVTSQPVTVTVEGGWSYGYVERTVSTETGQILSRGECGAASETVHVPAVDDGEVIVDTDDGELAITGSDVAKVAGLIAAVLLGGVSRTSVQRHCPSRSVIATASTCAPRASATTACPASCRASSSRSVGMDNGSSVPTRTATPALEGADPDSRTPPRRDRKLPRTRQATRTTHPATRIHVF